MGGGGGVPEIGIFNIFFILPKPSTILHKNTLVLVSGTCFQKSTYSINFILNGVHLTMVWAFGGWLTCKYKGGLQCHFITFTVCVSSGIRNQYPVWPGCFIVTCIFLFQCKTVTLLANIYLMNMFEKFQCRLYFPMVKRTQGQKMKFKIKV